MRREYPDLVTLEPAEDDEEVFGDAWALIVEWRELKGAHPNDGRGLAWLAEEERLRVVELALLEDHGMTLPPEKRPLRGFDRDGQINWRRTALFDTRRALRKRELLNRLSFGLCGGSRAGSAAGWQLSFVNDLAAVFGRGVAGPLSLCVERQ